MLCGENVLFPTVYTSCEKTAWRACSNRKARARRLVSPCCFTLTLPARALHGPLAGQVVPMGGYWWQLMDSGGNKLAGNAVNAAKCKSTLAGLCVAKPSFWNRMTMNNIPKGELS